MHCVDNNIVVLPSLCPYLRHDAQSSFTLRIRAGTAIAIGGHVKSLEIEALRIHAAGYDVDDAGCIVMILQKWK